MNNIELRDVAKSRSHEITGTLIISFTNAVAARIMLSNPPIITSIILLT